MNLSGKFFGKLRVEYLDGIDWKVLNPAGPDQFGFQLDDGRKVIPADGFITNFASIPRLVQNILPPAGTGRGGKYRPGAVIHDLVYETGEIAGKPVTRHEADHLLKACNVAVEVEDWIVDLIHHALVVGGGPTWDHYRNNGTRVELMSCHEWVRQELHQNNEEG